MIPPLFTILTAATTSNQGFAGWQSFVKSASDAASDLGGAKYMLIAVGVLVVLYINLRLARWITASIKFDPPHPPKHSHHHNHSPHH